MNWIILVLAGLCECGFAFCLGKANIATGGRQVLWYVVFLFSALFDGFFGNRPYSAMRG